MKKFVCLLLALCLVLGFAPMVARAVPVQVDVMFRQACSQGATGYAVDVEGNLWTWTGDKTPYIFLDHVKEASAGFNHMVALRTDGTVWTWGSNFNGRLGDGTTTHRDSPVQILDQVTAISAGAYHSLAIRADGSLWAWGSNNCGQIGDGTTNDALRPKKIADGVIAISGGEDVSLFIKSDQSLWGMGANFGAELGSLSFDNVLRPVRLMEGVKAVSSSSGLIIKTDGGAYEFGTIWQREYRQTKTRDFQRRPSVGWKLGEAAKVESGSLLRFVIRNDGTLWAWGTNMYGELGDGTFEGTATPHMIMRDVCSISVGGQTCLAIKNDGSLWGWGRNDQGQLRDGTAEDRAVPHRITVKTIVEMPTPFADVAAETYYVEPVKWAVEAKITSGVDKTHFAPEETCTRGQIVTFLWRAKGKPKPASALNPFTDVTKDDYYYDAVLWAVERGITKGTSKTTFGPNEGCTREQVVTFLWRAEGKPKAAGTAVGFTDVAEDSYAKTAIAWAVVNKITKGTSKTTFSPGEDCTRGQIVTFLYRALGE